MFSSSHGNGISLGNPPAIRPRPRQLAPAQAADGTMPRSISEEFKQYTDYKSYERRVSRQHAEGLGLSFDESLEVDSLPNSPAWQPGTTFWDAQGQQIHPFPNQQHPKLFDSATHDRSLSYNDATTDPLDFFTGLPVPMSPPRGSTLQSPLQSHDSPGSFTPLMLSPMESPTGSPMLLDSPGASPSYYSSRSNSPVHRSPMHSYSMYSGNSPSPMMLFASLAPSPVAVPSTLRTYVTNAGGASPKSPSKKKASADGSKAKKGNEKEKAKGPKKSVLQPPKPAPSKWQIFFAEYLMKVKEEDLVGQKINIIQIAKDASAAYKELSVNESEVLTRRARQAKEQYNREYAQWQKTLTPDDVKQENAFRTAQRKSGSSRKTNMKDPNAPARPMSPYFVFLQSLRGDPGLAQEVFQGSTDQKANMKLAADRWRSMTELEKKPYFTEAETQKQDYAVKLKEYESQFEFAGHSKTAVPNIITFSAEKVDG